MSGSIYYLKEFRSDVLSFSDLRHPDSPQHASRAERAGGSRSGGLGLLWVPIPLFLREVI